MSNKFRLELASKLITIRFDEKLDAYGDWMVCSFELRESDITTDNLVKAFHREIDTYYTGDLESIVFMVRDVEYYPILYFLIPMRHKTEVGRNLFSFRISSN